jgi:hypothetical protein
MVSCFWQVGLAVITSLHVVNQNVPKSLKKIPCILQNFSNEQVSERCLRHLQFHTTGALCCGNRVKNIPYILESNPHPNQILTSFCRFLKQKKLVRGSNPHLSFNRPLPTRQTDWIILVVTNALTFIQLTRRVWSGHLRNCQRYKRTTADTRCGHLNASYIHLEA